MPVTHDDIIDFHHFAEQRLSQGPAESMDQLVAAWKDHRRHQASLAALEESHADAEAGRTIAAEDVFAETHKTLGLS